MNAHASVAAELGADVRALRRRLAEAEEDRDQARRQVAGLVRAVQDLAEGWAQALAHAADLASEAEECRAEAARRAGGDGGFPGEVR